MNFMAKTLKMRWLSDFALDFTRGAYSAPPDPWLGKGSRTTTVRHGSRASKPRHGIRTSTARHGKGKGQRRE
jgi:hypothetical protein